MDIFINKARQSGKRTAALLNHMFLLLIRVESIKRQTARKVAMFAIVTTFIKKQDTPQAQLLPLEGAPGAASE